MGRTAPHRGGDLEGLRRHNCLAVLAQLRGHDEMTASALVASTGLSGPSVRAVLADLEAMGWVESLDPLLRTVGGRPARRFRFRVDAGRVLGVDIGVHRAVAWLADLRGEPVARREIRLEPTLGPTRRLTVVDGLIDEVMGEANCGSDDVWAVTAGVTGAVDERGRTAWFTPLPGWGEVDLRAHLARSFPGLVRVENDCKLAVLAEHWRGAATDADDIVYIMAGRRVGAGLMIRGELHRGHGGAAGEIGALPEVGWDRIFDAFSEWESADGDEAVSRVFARALRGDARAQAAATAYGRSLAVGAAALVLTVDPQVVVFGGGSSRDADAWWPALTARLAELVLRLPDLRISALGRDDVVVGAIRHALLDVEEAWLGDEIRRPTLAAGIGAG